MEPVCLTFPNTEKQRENRRERAHTIKFSVTIRRMTRLCSPSTIWLWDKSISTSFNKGCIQEAHREFFPSSRDTTQKWYCTNLPDIFPQLHRQRQITVWQPDILKRVNLCILASQDSESGGRLANNWATERPEIYLTYCKRGKAWMHPSVTLQAID